MTDFWIIFFILLVCSPSHQLQPTEKGRKKWALIVAGAKGYNNYFSQALACRAYHLLRARGIPSRRLVLLSYDDVARHPLNPHQGNLVTSLDGPNVYQGCHIDYRGEEVTPELFLKVLSADRIGVERLILKGQGRGHPDRKVKVIASGPDDHLFVYLVDHGGPGGVFFFPGMTPLFADDLIDTIVRMRRNEQYRKMALYVEACYGGSMFDGGLLPGDVGVYAVTFANATEDSFRCCYDSVRKVHVGSVSGNAWMCQAETTKNPSLTFRDQLALERDVCRQAGARRRSHPAEFGDLSMGLAPISSFMGERGNPTTFTGSDSQTAGGRDAACQGDSGSAVTRFASESSLGLPRRFRLPSSEFAPISSLRSVLDGSRTNGLAHESRRPKLTGIVRMEALFDTLTAHIALKLLKNADASQIHGMLQGRQEIQNRKCYKNTVLEINHRCPAPKCCHILFDNRMLQRLINLCNEVNPSVNVSSTVVDLVSLLNRVEGCP